MVWQRVNDRGRCPFCHVKGDQLTCEESQLGMQRLIASSIWVVHAISAGIPLCVHSCVLARPRRLHKTCTCY